MGFVPPLAEVVVNNAEAQDKAKYKLRFGVMDVPYAQVMRHIFKLLIPLMVAWVLVTLMPWTTQLIQPAH